MTHSGCCGLGQLGERKRVYSASLWLLQVSLFERIACRATQVSLHTQTDGEARDVDTCPQYRYPPCTSIAIEGASHMPGLELEELEATARAAVLVSRSDLPVPREHPGRSFFGGLPKLPRKFVWPRGKVRSADEIQTVALTFIAQIDLTELPPSDPSVLLPSTGTLFFFCSSVFEGDGHPPCRVFYYPGSVDPHPQREPPPDLMPLAGEGGDYQVKWLDAATDLHSKVEFKYPLSFLPFRDFAFKDDPVGGGLLIGSLCEVLGRGDPKEQDLLFHRRADDFAKDEDWPFNWLLIKYVANSVLYHVKYDLKGSSYRGPLDDEARDTLQGFEASARSWLEQSGRWPPLQIVDTQTKEAFRTWWANVARTYAQMRGRVAVYPHIFPQDVGNAITHTIRYMSAYGELPLAPSKYVINVQKRNSWKTPTVKDGQNRFFSTAIHQIGGYGSSWQNAPAEHREDILLLQLQGDDAFFDWHTNTGCVLHFWIGRDALAELDFSGVEATLECD
jgi:uncharacterized protein YwqG